MKTAPFQKIKFCHILGIYRTVSILKFVNYIIRLSLNLIATYCLEYHIKKTCFLTYLWSICTQFMNRVIMLVIREKTKWSIYLIHCIHENYFNIFCNLSMICVYLLMSSIFYHFIIFVNLLLCKNYSRRPFNRYKNIGLDIRLFNNCRNMIKW